MKVYIKPATALEDRQCSKKTQHYKAIDSIDHTLNSDTKIQ